MTVSKEGYVTQTIIITKGPFVWASVDRSIIKYFYVVSSTYFNVKLQKVGNFLGGNPVAAKAANLTLIGVSMTAALMALLLWMEGRLLRCVCGEFKIWIGDTCSSNNSQQLFDPS